MGINNTLVPIKIISPQLIQQVLPGQYPALMGQQFPQYFKFLLCQFKISSVHCGGVAVTVQTQIAISNDLILFICSPVTAPKYSRNFAEQDRHRKRFCDVVIHLQIQSFNLIFFSA